MCHCWWRYHLHDLSMIFQVPHTIFKNIRILFLFLILFLYHFQVCSHLVIWRLLHLFWFHEPLLYDLIESRIYWIWGFFEIVLQYLHGIYCAVMLDLLNQYIDKQTICLMDHSWTLFVVVLDMFSIWSLLLLTLFQRKKRQVPWVLRFQFPFLTSHLLLLNFFVAVVNIFSSPWVRSSYSKTFITSASSLSSRYLRYLVYSSMLRWFPLIKLESFYLAISLVPRVGTRASASVDTQPAVR